MKEINIKEFREKGYLQELNRQFLHPLGLALSIAIDEDGVVKLNGIWDYRDDPEGMIYDIKNSDESRKDSFIKKAELIEQEKQKFAKQRLEKLGFVIEPIKGD